MDIESIDRLYEKYKAIENIPQIPKDVYGFRNTERKNTAHHLRHAKEMGYRDQKQYERSAIDFWKYGEGKIYYDKIGSKFYKYDTKTQRMVVISCDGILFTFYKITPKKFEKIINQEDLNALF